jgi:N12 class adenine-specific DNA methylase
MRFVPIKTDDQLDMQSLHRARKVWVRHRTAKTGREGHALNWVGGTHGMNLTPELFAAMQRSGRACTL